MFEVMESIVGGYLAALLMHFFLTFLITREGRGLLMTDGGLSRAYYLQSGLAWMLCGGVGAMVALRKFPALPMAGVVLVSVAGLLCMSLLRVRSKVPRQQTLGDTLLLLLCVLVGFAVPAYLQLA